jgi:glycosyltransferase involved in cell wall biosynthesis
MKLVVNAISAHTGGMVTYTNSILQRFTESGMSATVYVPREFIGKESVSEGAPIEVRGTKATHFRPIRRFLWEQSLWRQIVRKSGADVLFSSANYGLLRPPIPQVLLIQGEISFNPLYQELVLPRFSTYESIQFLMRRRLVLWSARKSDIVIFPSETSRDSVIRYDPSLKDRSTVIYLGTDESALQHEHSRPWRHDGTMRILYVSVYYPHKDPVTLATATRLLNEQGMNAHSWITMEPKDFKIWSTGPSELKCLRDEELAGNISMGRLPHAQVGNSMAGHDVLVSPSLAETFGFPLIEAMASGVPVVASDTEVHREVCGDAAIYFNPRDPDDLCRRLTELDQDPDLRKRLCKLGSARVREKYTWERHTKEMLACFERLAR